MPDRCPHDRLPAHCLWCLAETLETARACLADLVARADGRWDVDDAEPCPYCGEPACERSCTGGILADEDTEEDADA